MMECNRDEALKAREIAEKKFAAKDIIGAKKFAIKAQNLDPDLDGIGQMITTLNVHLSAEVMINGEKDWYAILSVKSSAEDEMVKKQYRKLALMLHPDKNKSIGAESAFKLISEAWRVLSDKTRRMAYDEKRKTQAGQQKFSQSYGSYGFYHFAKNAASSLKSYKSAARRNTVPPTKMPSSASSHNSFWTLCKYCKMQYEYYRIYLNQNILCPNCHEPFLASEITNPTTRSKSSAHCTTQNSHHHRGSHGHDRNDFASYGTGSMKFPNFFNLDSFDISSLHWGAFSRTAGAASAAASPSAAAQAARMVHQTYEKVKREREYRQAAAKRAETYQRKTPVSRKTSNGTYMGNSHGSSYFSMFDRECSIHSDEDLPAKKRRSIYEKDGTEWANGNTSLSFKSSSLQSNTCTRISGDFSVCRDTLQRRRNFCREFSRIDIQKMLMQKARKLVQKNLDDCSFTKASKAEEQKKAEQKQGESRIKGRK